MGPKDTYDVLTMKLTVPKLVSDGSNWMLYQEHIINVITSKKLHRHVIGTAHKLVALVKHDGSFFWDDNLLFLLSDKQIEEYKDTMEDWLQKEATIKGETTTTAVWKKLTSIYGNRGAMFETDLLAWLQNSCFIKNGEVMMHNHLANLIILNKCLTEIDCPLSDPSFTSYVHTSLSLAPSYKPHFMTLTANACVTEKPVSSQDLIWHINEEANNAAIESSINQHHKAMVAAHAKARERMDILMISVLRKVEAWQARHLIANVAKTEDKSEDNYAFLTFIPIDTPDYPANKNIALAITLGHSHEAHAASPSAGITIDCSASSHFSPSCDKFLNYQEINPEPVHAADGHTFSALGQGGLHISLSMKAGEKSVPILLKRVYYTPQMAFTLISVSCLDRAGCSLLIKDGMCIIHSPKLKCQVIGCIPAIHGLYCTNSSITSSSPKHTVNVALKSITISELHHQMGHINHSDLQEAVHQGVINGIELDMSSVPEFCEACTKGKAQCQSFPKKSDTKYTHYGKKIVSNLWGPAQIKSLGGALYSYTNIDLYTHEECIMFLAHKSNTFKAYCDYEAWVKVHQGVQIKTYGSD
ncbi:hypothetical protein E4T56_gene14204 [Termitomyces sp. T112]|nr:hypothetical protein E4T56_gene14204 [Termitomyces sp. T112]